MHILQTVLQIIIALGLLNVWLVRAKKETPYRGAGSRTIKGEFTAYGLPDWFVSVIGTLKVAIAVTLLVGLFIPALVAPAAGLLVILMIGAIVMHLKVGDPAKKSLPAALILLMSLVILL